jgi:hypothetical protein
MKTKILFAFAALMLAACAQEEVVTAPQHAISFSNTFIDNSTHVTKVEDPSITKAKLTGFDVWGYRDNTDEVVFEGEDVTPVAGTEMWDYTNTQYWIPESNYYFSALAPMNSTNWKLNTDGANTYGAGVVSFTNVEGTEDLLYSAVAVETPDLTTLLSAGMEPIELTFNHLLSKLKFTFTNGLDEDYMSLVVKNIKMTVPKEATIDLAVENWWDNNDWTITGTEMTTLAFGKTIEMAQGQQASSENQRLTIPAAKTQDYKIKFDVEVKMNGKATMVIPKTATLTDVEFQMGKSYNIKTTLTVDNLGLKPIEFEVEAVKKWITEGGEVTLY